MKTISLLFVSLLFATVLNAQTDWSKVDFADKYDFRTKIKGKSAKALKSDKLFISDYVISQATTMKGSQKTATNAVYSEVDLVGINQDAYQAMVDNAYKQLSELLQGIGLNLTSGEDVLSSAYGQKKKSKNAKLEFIGNTGNKPAVEGKMKITDGMILGYPAIAVTRDISFPPANVNRYASNNRVTSGLFFQNMAKKEKFNLLTIHYNISFATFDGGKGYKSISLSTNPVMAVNATAMIYTTDMGWIPLYFKKMPVWAGVSWSEGVFKTDDNKSAADFLGLARSGEYVIKANSEKYINELESIILKIQKDMVEQLSNELK